MVYFLDFVESLVLFLMIHAASSESKCFAYAKTKAQISCVVSAQLISAFVFATRIVQFLLYFKPESQASSRFRRLYRPVWVRHGRKIPKSGFSGVVAHYFPKVY